MAHSSTASTRLLRRRPTRLSRKAPAQSTDTSGDTFHSQKRDVVSELSSAPRTHGGGHLFETRPQGQVTPTAQLREQPVDNELLLVPVERFDGPVGVEVQPNAWLQYQHGLVVGRVVDHADG